MNNIYDYERDGKVSINQALELELDKKDSLVNEIPLSTRVLAKENHLIDLLQLQSKLIYIFLEEDFVKPFGDM